MFEELAWAVETYPHTYVDLEIVDVEIPGDVLQPGMEGSFRVKLTNDGPLALVSGRVVVRALNGALVKTGHPDAVYGTEFVTDGDHFSGPIAPAGGQQVSEGDKFWFRAPTNPQPTRNLIRAELKEWSVQLSPISTDRSPHVARTNGTYPAEVVPGART